ncbi:MAG TPA: alpha/beta fold hydrolase, partial [Micromonosporaceae bacterium]
LELGRPLATDLVAHGYLCWNIEYRRVGNGGGWPNTLADVAAAIDHLADLAAHGYTCWNLEYRRVGNGGGWPATFEDIAAGIDRLAELDVDLSAVVAIGHSAGGHLAVWAAGRAALPVGAPGAQPRVLLCGVVAQAGVLDLVTAARTRTGQTAVPDLLGGMPADLPDRYALADPIQQVPIAAPVLCLHSRADDNVPYAQSTGYVVAATAAGGTARLDETAGDHFTVIDPKSPAWAAARAALPDLLTGRLRSG